MEIIVQSRSSEQTVSFAAEEIRRYLTRMLSGEEGVFSVFLEVSGTEKADSFRLTMDSAGGTITGSNPRSVLLGVYDYLHHLGCRFPGPGQEVVPSVRRQQLPATYSRRASFLHRGVCIEGADSVENVLDFIDWLPKVGYNSFFLQFQVPYIFLARWYHHDLNPFAQPEAFTMADAERCCALFEAAMKKRGLLLHKVGHGWTGEVLGCETVGSWNPASGGISPDKRPLAAQIQGKRDFYMGIPANTNLCLSNPDTVNAFAELVVSYARRNPSVDYLHVWLADDYNNVCECAQCRQTTVSDQYVALLNEIDRRLTEEKLSTRLVFLLYQELLWPPLKSRLNHPDRFVLMFAPISRTFEASYTLTGEKAAIPAFDRNHITLPTSLSQNLAFLRGWQAQFRGESFVYDYPLGRAHYGDFGYVGISRIIHQDIRKLRQMGLDGYISCQELRAGSPNTLPNYVMGRTLFDETADGEQLIREYFEAAYPEQPEAALAHLELLSRLSSCDYINGKGPRVNPDMASRMEAIIRACRETEQRTDLPRTGGWWPEFHYHNRWIPLLAAALQAMAMGQEEESRKRYGQFRDCICQAEPEFQSQLDVYRILEVTQKYTGFPQEQSLYGI